ncbi:MAG TPA: carbohydrate binding domain-containing protein [Blastocatellia bacterium]
MKVAESFLVVNNRPLNGRGVKVVFGLVSVVALSGMVYLACSTFVVGSLSDRRVDVEPEVMARAAAFFPKSASMQWRLADAELAADDADLSDAENHARLAVELSPNRFEYRLTLAAAQEALGDRDAAESSLRSATLLAPHDASVRWQLANLLFRKGDLAASLEQFKMVCDADPTLLPSALNLLWNPNTNDTDSLDVVVPKDSASQLLFARFLADQGRSREAARVFLAVDPAIRLTSPETRIFIDLLVSDGAPELARSVWANTGGIDTNDLPVVWNGGFETVSSPRPYRFDWVFRDTKYARIGIDDHIAHSGNRSLKVEFARIDTTRLNGEIAQTVVLKPATTYHLSFYAKTDGFVSPAGPRVSLGISDSKWQILTDPIQSGSHDWTLVSADFTTPLASPAGAATTMPPPTPVAATAPPEREQSLAAVLSIVREPAFSYDDPTSGTVWFDDFSITTRNK